MRKRAAEHQLYQARQRANRLEKDMLTQEKEVLEQKKLAAEAEAKNIELTKNFKKELKHEKKLTAKILKEKTITEQELEKK